MGQEHLIKTIQQNKKTWFCGCTPEYDTLGYKPWEREYFHNSILDKENMEYRYFCKKNKKVFIEKFEIVRLINPPKK